MAEYQLLYVLLYVLLRLSVGLGGPLTKSNADLDSPSVEIHMVQLEETVSRLQGQFKVHEQTQATVLTSVLTKLASTTDELINLKSDFDDLEQKYNRTSTRTVAFMAGFHHMVYLTDGEVAKFDAVIINIGNGYNTSTGIFTSPESGIYEFQIHALSNSYRTMLLEIVHNGNATVIAYINTGNSITECQI